MIYRNLLTGHLVRAHRTSSLLQAPIFEQELILTGERRALASLDDLKLVRED